MPQFDRIAIIGVGLLGGSIARGVRERSLAGEIVGIGRSRFRLEEARQAGLVDRVATDVAGGIAGASLVVVGTPVELVADIVVEALGSLDAQGQITDVASTKRAIVAEVARRTPAETRSRFIGSHPLAGDHRSGWEHARSDLLVGRTVVITPTDDSPPADVERLTQFWEGLGAQVVSMAADQHDTALAVTSHLPHLVASALALTTPADLRTLVATGWLDTTRVAAGDAPLWRQIFASNREEVLAALDRFGQHLRELQTALADGNDASVEQLLAEGKRIRDAVGN